MLMPLLLATAITATCPKGLLCDINPVQQCDPGECWPIHPQWYAIWHTADDHVEEEAFPTKKDCEDELSILRHGVTTAEYDRITKLLEKLDPPLNCFAPKHTTCVRISSVYYATSNTLTFGECRLATDLPSP